MKCLLSVVYLSLPVFMECAEARQLPFALEVPTTPTSPNSQPIKIPVVTAPKKLLSEEFTRSVFACSLWVPGQIIVQKPNGLPEEENTLEKTNRNLSPDSKNSEEEKSESSTAVASDGEDGVFTLDLGNSEL